MAVIFISHSSIDNAAAIALRDWLVCRPEHFGVFKETRPHRELVWCVTSAIEAAIGFVRNQ
jgi:hypothetical protein